MRVKSRASSVCVSRMRWMPALMSLRPADEPRGTAGTAPPELTGTVLRTMVGRGDPAENGRDEDAGVGTAKRDGGEASFSIDGRGMSTPAIPWKLNPLLAAEKLKTPSEAGAETGGEARLGSDSVVPSWTVDLNGECRDDPRGRFAMSVVALSCTRQAPTYHVSCHGRSDSGPEAASIEGRCPPTSSAPVMRRDCQN
jgi:hypothetical protein